MCVTSSANNLQPSLDVSFFLRDMGTPMVWLYDSMEKVAVMKGNMFSPSINRQSEQTSRLS